MIIKTRKTDYLCKNIGKEVIVSIDYFDNGELNPLTHAWNKHILNNCSEKNCKYLKKCAALKDADDNIPYYSI